MSITIDDIHAAAKVEAGASAEHGFGQPGQPFNRDSPFFIGVVGLLIRRNILVILMCVELMLNAVNLTFVTFSDQLKHMGGQMSVFFIITVAAAESAVGRGLVIAMFRTLRSGDTDHQEYKSPGCGCACRDPCRKPSRPTANRGLSRRRRLRTGARCARQKRGAQIGDALDRHDRPPVGEREGEE